VNLTVERLQPGFRGLGCLWFRNPIFNKGRARIVVDLWSVRLGFAMGKAAK
jgi:hypothetical protein